MLMMTTLTISCGKLVVDTTPETGSANNCYCITENGYYVDGSLLKIKTAPATDSPVVIVIMPDGFTRNELSEGGVFEQRARQACDALFEYEPIKSLKDYIEVNIRFYASYESGVSLPNRKVNTYFGVNRSYDQYLAYDCNIPVVYQCLETVPGKHTNKIALILVNETKDMAVSYFGFWEDGSVSSFCIIPAFCPEEKDFRYCVLHECAGHCIGGLTDEYVTFDDEIPEEERAQRGKMQKAGLYQNISFSKENAPWNKFIGLEGYENVSYFEGADQWSKGIYRSEENSIMRTRIMYFNAISRENIYKRIMTLTGNSYTWENFLEFDKKIR